MKPALTSVLTILILLESLEASAASLPETRNPAEIVKTSSSRLTVVNVWATWCIPCVAEMDDLRRVDVHFRDADVRLVGVSLDDVIPGERSATKAKVKTFLAERRVTYQNVYYTGKLAALEDFLRFEGEIPITIIFDRAGKELARTQGIVTKAGLIRQLEQLLKRSR
ncbi:MAG TPA: TlpA disulfide reductase family protein [Thermoanaerobaculia bacterium]|nr:TlpA disulfide reductase family protein [Thermoanaerobaculia bacterium]